MTDAAYGTSAFAKGSSTAPSATKPTGLADNDYVVWICAQEAVSNTVTPPTGFTLIKQGGFGSYPIAMYGKYISTASGEPSSYTGSLSGSADWYCGAIRITGTNLGPDTNKNGGINGDASGNYATASLTTTTTGGLIIICQLELSAGMGTWTPDAALTEIDDRAGSVNCTFQTTYKVAATAASYGGYTNVSSTTPPGSNYGSYCEISIAQGKGVAPALLTLSTIAAAASPTVRAVSTKGTVVPSSVAAQASLNNLGLVTRPLLTISQVAAQSAMTGILSTKALIVPSQVDVLSALTGILSAPAPLTLSSIATLSNASAVVISLVKLTLSQVDAIAGLSNLVLVTRPLLAPSNVAAVSSLNNLPLASPWLPTLSVTAQSNLTGTVSAKAEITLSSIDAQSALNGTVSARVLLLLSSVDAVSTTTLARLLSITKLILSPIAATSTVVLAIYSPDRSGLVGRIRADIYSLSNGTYTRVGGGPLTDIFDFKQTGALDRVGTASIRMAADDVKAMLVVPDVELRLFREGEGFVGDYDVIETDEGLDTSNKPIKEAQLVSVEGRLARYDTGLGMTVNSSPAVVLAALLALASGFTSGTAGTSSRTLQRRHDADNIWEALVNDAQPFGFHIRANVLGSGASPTRTIDMDAFGADSGIVLGNGGSYPLKNIRKHSTRARLTRVIPIGVGEGYPALTLKAATLGANFLADPHIETSTADWTAVSCTVTRIVGGYYGRYTMQLASTSALQPSCYASEAITGTSTGRKAKAGFWIQGDATSYGMTASLTLYTTGGTGVDVASGTPLTLTSGFQYIEAELTLGVGRTAVYASVSLASSASGKKMQISRPTFWESTTDPYCTEYDPSATLPLYFIADNLLESTSGVLREFKAYKGEYPTAATKAAWQGACDAMYNTASEYLDLSKVGLTTYTAKPVGLQLVNGATQLVKPGDKIRVRHKGVTEEPGEAVSATINLQVSANDDDGSWQAAVGGSWAGSGGASAIGDWDGGLGGHRMYSSYIRFNNVTIPQGATVSAADIQLQEYSDNPNANTVNAIIYGVDEDNATAPTSRADANARSLTTASVAVPAIGNWTDGVWYTSADISTIIQEIVNRPGWVSGNSIVIYLADNGSSSGAYRTFYAYETAGASAPKLDITYLAPAVPTSRAWLTVDALLWLMEWNRRYLQDGSDDWDLKLSSIDAHYLDSMTRLMKLLTEWKGSQTDLKQYNFVTTFTNANTTPFSGVNYRMVELKLKDMWIHKATLTVQQVSSSGGAAATTEIYVYTDTGYTVATGLDARTSHDYDITSYLVQSPTPVPQAEANFVSGLTYIKPLVQVQNVNAAVSDIVYSISVRIEASKIPQAPS